MDRLVSQKTSLDQLSINTIRFLGVDAVEKAKSGHPGLPMEAATIGYALWTKALKHNPQNSRWPNRDRFILSAGHGSMLIYSLLYLTGYDLTLEDIKAFRQWESKTPGHPEYGVVPGVETTTGPLGQGFSNGVGMGIAQRFLAAKFNQPGFPIVDYRVYVICSDGDLMEGMASEAASLAGHLKLGNLTYIYLDNHITIEGDTSLAFSEDVGKRFEAYHWQVQHVEGNDLPGILKAIDKAGQVKNQPSIIIARTHSGYGSPNKQDTAQAHGTPLGPDEVKLTKEHLGWPLAPDFYVPEEVLSHCRQGVQKGKKEEEEWGALFAAYEKKYPDHARLFNQFLKGELPENWKKVLPRFEPKDGPLATRQASGKTINALSPVLPFLFGGSADLAPSTETLMKDSPDQLSLTPQGRNMHFGVREHNMAGSLNGIALSGAGFIPYGATFLIFLDYLKPSLRLAALMNLRVIYVFTHDSIGLGEDGPTHQSVEQLAQLRATPNVIEIRPADANETVVAWRVAVEHRTGPVAIILSRQKLPIVDRQAFASAELLEKGAYVLAGGDETPEIILMASGSEVTIALEAHKILTDKKIKSRIVSFPSFALFRKQEKKYRDEVLPPSVKKRIVIEAASPFGWHEFAGEQGEILALDHFGASAPYEDIYKGFGLTREHLVEKALAVLGKQ